MKSAQSLKAVRILALAILATGLSAGVASAQQYTAKVTLPVRTHWGNAVLPPGDYVFSVESASPYTMVLRRRTREFVAFVMPTAKSLRGPVAGPSELIGIRRGGTLRIRQLRLAEAELTLGYSLPKGERQFVADKRPELVQRIAIAMNGK
jgi:hypothetical protein